MVELDEFVQQVSGGGYYQPVVGATVSVYQRDTTTLVSLFTDDGGTPLSQPLTTDRSGRVVGGQGERVWLNPAAIDVVATKGTYTWTIRPELVSAIDATDPELTALAALNSATTGVPRFTGLGAATLLGFDTDPTLAANSDTKLVSQKAAKAYVDALLAASDAVVYKGAIDCSANPNYPAADAGHLYRVSVAGKIGGASGVNVEVGDTLLCKQDGSAAGNQAAVGANWNVIQANIDGAVIGPASAVDGHIAQFNGTTGKLIKDAGLVVGSGAGTVAAGDDSRLSNARTPTAHKTSHATGGSDVLLPSDIGATSFVSGTQAARLAASHVLGTLWKETDTGRVYYDTGSAWVLFSLAAVTHEQGQAGTVCPPGVWPSLTFALIANRAYFARFVPRRDFALTLGGFIVTTADAADNACDFAILDSSYTRLGSAGSTLGKMNSTGIKTVAFTSTINVTAGGTYYAMLLTASTASVAAIFGNVTGFGDIFGTAAGTRELGQLTAGAPPIGAGPFAVAVGQTNVPFMFVREV